MAKRIAVGSEDFTALRKADSYYVDKTELLYDLVQNSNNTVTLFTRPCRFGKTLTMSMMESFFDVSRKENQDIFNGLKIMNHPDFCREYMNQYPVIFLSLKDVEGLNFDIAFKKLKAVIADLCKKLEWLGDRKEVNPFDREIFLKMQAKTEDVEEVQNFLKTLMRMMHAVYGKKVILLIDEYDVPLAKAYSNGYYREMLDVIRGIMSVTLKTNDYLKFAVITGCLRIPKESIFTEVNNFASYSVLDEDFAEYFGFSAQEVKEMLQAFGFEGKSDMIRDWYDGYIFGNSEVYCPWDVVNYVSALLKRANALPKNYWENTSGHDAIRAFFDLEGTDISDKFEALLNGENIWESVTDALTYDQAYESEANLWSVLLMTGYVTKARKEAEVFPDAEHRQLALRIPNREIAGIFQTAVVDHFRQTTDTSQIAELMEALWNGDEAKASEILSDLLWHTISYMDYHEDYYHAFLTGIFMGRGGYIVRSNEERDLGRPDIDLRDKKNRRALILEAKKSDRKEDMEKDCEEALRQIRDKEYAKDLEGYRQVLSYGISFYKKTAMVKRNNNE